MIQRKIYQTLASLIVARQNCERSHNAEWLERHTERIDSIMDDTAPSGAGIDNGTSIDLERSTGEKLVFTFGFHHMDEHGYYDGWNHYEAIVCPTFDGIDVKIKGRNRNDIKPYLRDLFHHWLTSEYQEATQSPETASESKNG